MPSRKDHLGADLLLRFFVFCVREVGRPDRAPASRCAAVRWTEWSCQSNRRPSNWPALQEIKQLLQKKDALRTGSPTHGERLTTLRYHQRALSRCHKFWSCGFNNFFLLRICKNDLCLISPLLSLHFLVYYRKKFPATMDFVRSFAEKGGSYKPNVGVEVGILFRSTYCVCN